MRFFLLLLLSLPVFAQTTGQERLLETTTTAVNFPMSKGFNKNGPCPEVLLKVKALLKKEKLFLSFHMDANEPIGIFRVSKKNTVRPKLKAQSEKRQQSIEIHRGSILHFISDLRFLTGTISADVADLKEKKVYIGCTYYINNELKK